MNLLFIIAFLLLNPSITFGLISAEVFPYATIFGLFFIRKIFKPFFYIILYITFLALFSLFYYNYPSDFLRSYIAFINPLMGVLLIYSNQELRKIFIKYAKYYFYFLIFLGLVQYLNLIPFLDGFLKFLVPRSSAESLDYSGRGVTLLSTEPARAGIELLFIFAFLKIFNTEKQMHYFIDLFFFIFIAVVLKSFTVLVITAFYFSVINFKINRLILYLILFFLFGVIYLNFDDTSRSTLLLKELSALSFDDQYFLLVNTSGNRLISILTFYIYGFHSVIGGGIGNWVISSMKALKYSKIDPSTLNFFQYDYNDGMRGSGYLTNLVLDTGVVGLLPVIYILFQTLFRVVYFNRIQIGFLFIFILNIFFIGSVGTTNIWVLFFVFFFEHNSLINCQQKLHV